MDFKNNGQVPANFMSRLKKQSKRLFTISKQPNSTLYIKNLSEAQNIIAQINCHPDWHSIQKFVNNADSENYAEHYNGKHSQDINNENISFQLINGVYVYENEDFYESYIKYNIFDEKSEDIESLINSFKTDFTFTLNMGYSVLDLIYEQFPEKNEDNLQYNLIQLRKSLNLSAEDANALFFIKKTLKNHSTNNNMNLYLRVKTSKNFANEHIEFVKDILKHYNSERTDTENVENISYLTSQRIERFSFKNGKFIKNLTTSLIFNNDDSNSLSLKELIPKWITVLNLLENKKIDFAFKIDIMRKELSYDLEITKEQESFIDNLITSIIKTNSFKEASWIYKPKVNFKSNSHNNEFHGLQLESLLSEKPFIFTHGFKHRTCAVNLILGRPGTGKSVLNSIILLNSFLAIPKEDFPTTVIMDIGTFENSMLNLVENCLEKDIKIENFNIINKKSIVNVFDLPLGKRKYEPADIKRIANSLNALINHDNKFIKTDVIDYLEKILIRLNSKEDNLFHHGLDKDIDNELSKNNFKSDSQTKWWDVVDYLFNQQKPSLAELAQAYASPTLCDVPYLIDMVDLVFLSDSEKKLQYYVKQSIIDVINKNTWLGKPTNLRISNQKIAYFNFKHIVDNAEKNIINYWFSIILDVCKSKLLNSSKERIEKINDWRKEWTYYIGRQDIEYVYSYYHSCNYDNNNRANTSQIFIDELSCRNHKNINDDILLLVRESRKENIEVTISSQSIEGLTPYSDYASTAFISNADILNKTETNVFTNYNISHLERHLIKKSKFNEWTVIDYSFGKRKFDIVNLHIPLMLQNALATNIDVVEVRNHLYLFKNNSYMNALQKMTNYLKKTNNTSFKKIIDNKKNDNNYSLNDLIEDIDCDTTDMK